MMKSQGLGVQGLSGEGVQPLSGRLGKHPEAPRCGAPVERVTQEGMASVAQMDPDLVGPAGQEAAG